MTLAERIKGAIKTHAPLLVPLLNFPEPTDLLRERGPEEPYPDKSLGLWRLSDVPG